ncbi:DUF4145 domain-containing protein [Olleya namhaensis]|uniref:DUF4145 domain-containing protein n=1 Tax=Olleya namhaensis TaxID=1144750 RepID=UPI0024900636|nr:DUF4145 domain-containing protein [Olleya namhaensis]
MNYYKADVIWKKKWEINNEEEFVKQLLIKGKFHNNVPENIIKEYKTVEYLICHSYYHYPIIDEAFSKCTRIFELSINQRIKELDIKCKESESLNSKIKKLQNYTTESLKDEWDAIRKIRNDFAHPKDSTVKGITLINAFYNIVNVLNTIFIDKSIIKKAEISFESIQEQCLEFHNKLFVLEKDNKKYLIRKLELCSTNLNSNIFLFAIYPVFKNIKIDKQNAIPMPSFLELYDISFDDSYFYAKTIENDRVIKIYKTNHVEDINSLNNFKNQLSKVTKESQSIYLFLLDNKIIQEISKFHYIHNWTE